MGSQRSGFYSNSERVIEFLHPGVTQIKLYCLSPKVRNNDTSHTYTTYLRFGRHGGQHEVARNHVLRFVLDGHVLGVGLRKRYAP